MTSTLCDHQQFFSHHHHHRPESIHSTRDYDYDYRPAPPSAFPVSSNVYNIVPDASTLARGLALLEQYSNLYQTTPQQPTSLHLSTPQSTAELPNVTPNSLPSAIDAQQYICTPGGTAAPQYSWMYQPSMGGPASYNTQGLKRARTHQRTPSASTIGSNGPSSPYTQNWSYPQIANSDFAPNSPALSVDQQANFGAFAKQLASSAQFPVDSGFLSAGYVPSTAAHTGGAYQAMKGFAIDHYNGEGFASEFLPFSRPSMSSNGHDSPATPQSGGGEPVPNGQYSTSQNDYRPPPNPNVQLFRTESAAYQDELYNPPTTTYTSAPTATKTTRDLLSPHRNLVTERLNTANIARSHSPSSAMSRERSPFRDGSPLAPLPGWRSPAGPVNTAAGMRQQQKDQADQAELAQHRPQLKREPTKTISPKDALLDYNEQEQQPLFQDSIPPGYKQHTGVATEQWQNNNSTFYSSQPATAFGSLATAGQQFGNFRATSADGYSGADQTNTFQPSLPPQQDVPAQIPNGGSFGNFSFPKMDNRLEPNPQFPAQLTSMESSASDHGLPDHGLLDHGLSSGSQESVHNDIQRPSDTRAATGTYTCTYHGCAQRFDSHANLQKHKRDTHRAQHQHDNSGGATSSAGTVSASPRGSESPAAEPSTDGLTAASLAARNSQTGPHKCTRINPSTNKPCNTIFSRPYDLTRHEDTIHNNRKMKVRCPMCREEKTFSRNDALTRHMRVVHPEIETFGKRGIRG